MGREGGRGGGGFELSIMKQKYSKHWGRGGRGDQAPLPPYFSAYITSLNVVNQNNLSTFDCHHLSNYSIMKYFIIDKVY